MGNCGGIFSDSKLFSDKNTCLLKNIIFFFHATQIQVLKHRSVQRIRIEENTKGNVEMHGGSHQALHRTSDDLCERSDIKGMTQEKLASERKECDPVIL